MARYQVKLFKDLLSSDGHPFHCLQSVTDVDADGPSAAIRQVLDELHGKARDWSISVSSADGSIRHNGVPLAKVRHNKFCELHIDKHGS